MRPTPIALRERVVAARTLDGQSMGYIAQRFRIPKGTVQNILARYREAGTVEPKPQNAVSQLPSPKGEGLAGLNCSGE